MSGVDRRLQRLLGGAQLAPLRMRLRRRFERQPLDDVLIQIRLDGLTAEERSAIASLTGSPAKKSKSISIDVATLDSTLANAGIASSLRQALEQLDGPIVHIATARAEEARRWEEVASRCSEQRLANWVLRPSSIGLLKRLSKSDPGRSAEFCRRAEAILNRLPAPGTTRSQLAAELLGDAHALDDGEAVATLVLSVLRGTREVDPDGLEPEEERARNVWASVGVLVNELARPALFLNVPFEGASECAANPGEPQFASLRWLLRGQPRWLVSGLAVYVCENPNLVAIAADRLGTSCLPFVCTDGMPAAAQRTLLRQLCAAGARLRYHGDFDWPGLRIANHVIGTYGAHPWRMSALDYMQAVGSSPAVRCELSGKPTVANWDEQLARNMESSGTAVAEEAVADTLLADMLLT